MNSIISGFCQIVRTAFITLLLLAGVACSGDPRPLQEAVEVSDIGLTRLTIDTGITLTEDIYINPAEQLQFDFTAYDAEANELAVVNTDRRWSVSDNNVASITDQGLLTGLSNGQVSVGIRIGGVIAAPVTVFVSDAELASIDKFNGPASLTECSRSEAYSVLGTYTDASERELKDVTWSLTDPDSGVLLDATTESVVVGALSPGSITLRAQENGVSGDFIIGVEPGVDAYTVVPEELVMERSSSTSLVARATYGENAIASVSEITTWTLLEDNGVATLNQQPGETGVITSVEVGSTSVRATCGDQTGTVFVTVTLPGEITRLEIDTSEDPLILNLTSSGEQLVVLASTQGGSVENVASLASWQILSGDTVLSVDNTGSDKGFITPLQSGSAVVEASYGGEEATLRVTVR